MKNKKEKDVEEVKKGDSCCGGSCHDDDHNCDCGDDCECGEDGGCCCGDDDDDDHHHDCCGGDGSCCEDDNNEDFDKYFENEARAYKKHKCGRFILVLVAVLALAGIVIVSILRDKIVNNSYRSVTVSGQGRVSYNPDIAILNLGVQIDKAETAEKALNDLNSKMTAIVNAVKEAGVLAEDIQTQNYSLYPQYDYKDNISVVSGYNANQQVIVKVLAYDKDPEKLSRVLSAASKAGINQVNSLAFDATNMNDLKQEAKIKAIADAKIRGEEIADAAGVELKEITGWYENFVSPTPLYMDYSAKGGMGAGNEAAYSATVPSGSREVIMEMNISYNIK